MKERICPHCGAKLQLVDLTEEYGDGETLIYTERYSCPECCEYSAYRIATYKIEKERWIE